MFGGVEANDFFLFGDAQSHRCPDDQKGDRDGHGRPCDDGEHAQKPYAEDDQQSGDDADGNRARTVGDVAGRGDADQACQRGVQTHVLRGVAFFDILIIIYRLNQADWINCVNNSIAGLTHLLLLYPHTAESCASVSSVSISSNSPLFNSFCIEKVGK